MSLLEIWKENPDQISEKRVDQIIGFADLRAGGAK